MKRITTFFTLTLLLLISAYSQESTTLNTSYSILLGDVKNIEQLEDLKESFESIDFVQKVKINYNQEKGSKGQMIVYVSEKLIDESIGFTFSPKVLKHLLLEEQLEIVDFKSSKL